MKIRPAVQNLGLDLMAMGTDNFIFCYSKDGVFDIVSSDRTWALGAARRVVASLEEYERIKTRMGNME